jgi:hypothetical protein
MGKFKQQEIEASPDRTDFPTEGDFILMQVSHAKRYVTEISDRVDSIFERMRLNDSVAVERLELEILKAAITDLERTLK